MKKVNRLLVMMLLSVLLGLASCLDTQTIEDPTKQLNADITAIDNYLIANPPTGLVVKDPNGLRIVVEELGTKLPAKSFNAAAPTTVDVNYVGRLFSDGTIFDQGNVSGITGDLSKLIDGWKIAFTTLPVGTKARLYIPSYRGYGKNGSGSTIPPNSILIFDIVFRDALITTAEINKLKSDTALINDYLIAKAIPNVVQDTSGISYVFTQQGGGAPASWFSKLKVKFVYKLLTDDTKVVATVEREPSDYFYSRPVDYIHGLKVGLQKMTAGSKATFYIPSGLGFGTLGATDGNGVTLIPANANLIVEVEVTSITP